MLIMRLVDDGMSMVGMSVVEMRSTLSFEMSYHTGLLVMALFVVFWFFFIFIGFSEQLWYLFFLNVFYKLLSFGTVLVEQH